VFTAGHRGRREAHASGGPSTPGSGAPSAAQASDARFGRSARLVALVALVGVLAGCGGSSHPSSDPSASSSRFDGSPTPSGLGAPNFTLHDQHGQLVSLAGQRGKFVVITFLYVHCTNVCPVIAGQLNSVLRSLPPAARNQVRVLAVSVDPKGDTPAAVAHFIAEHRLLPQFLYLTGSEHQLQPIWKGYHIASVQTGNNVTVGHTAIEFLLNRQGQPQLIYDSTNTPAQILHDLHLLGLQV
jgi:protein SCO1/2